MASQVAPVERSEEINSLNMNDEELSAEIDQYNMIMKNIETFESQLEGLDYVPSNKEENFKKASTFLIVILMFLMIAH